MTTIAQFPIPAGIDYASVSRYFARNVPGGNAQLHFEPISGGRSNLTYKVSSKDQTWVLRRPPLGHVLPTAHDMSREFKVLSGLANTPVPVPRPITLCTDSSVNRQPFYLMEYREGTIVADELPEGYAATETERRAMGNALVRTLVDLHAVDYEAVGLGDFGRPEGYLERQIRRWAEQWERSETRPLPEIQEVIHRLRRAIPESPPPTIVHGDYRLGNMMLAEDDPGRVVAVLDWEMATLGDPLSDLAYTLFYWSESSDSDEMIKARGGNVVTSAPGFPSRADIALEYERRSGRSLDQLEFYQVLAMFKMACFIEGIHARFLAGETVGDGFEGWGERAEILARLSLQACERAETPQLRNGK